jgi:Coenzyme PQQ synthesis protein D (PqqD)
MNYQINSEKILFTQLGDEGVVYNMESNEYVTLNESYFKILKGVEEGKNPTEITTELVQEYDINETECLAEITTALQELASKKFISLV